MGTVHEVRVHVMPFNFVPDFDMIVQVPDNIADEKFISELLESVFKEDLCYNLDWEFID